jgi:hypothetical protein
MSIPNSLNDIDDDVLNEIYKLLNPEDKVSILNTSRYLRDVVKDEKYEDKIQINFGDAINIKSHLLPKFGTKYEIYPNVFIYLTLSIYGKYANVKIEITNYENVSFISRGKLNNDKKIVSSNSFINIYTIQLNEYKLYTFELNKVSYILGVNRDKIFIWSCPTERIENKSLDIPYVYKFMDNFFTDIRGVDFKKFELFEYSRQYYSRYDKLRYGIDIDKMDTYFIY